MFVAYKIFCYKLRNSVVRTRRFYLKFESNEGALYIIVASPEYIVQSIYATGEETEDHLARPEY